MELQQYDIVRGTWRPSDASTVRDEASPLVGYRGEWLAAWIIEDGRFEGEYAMTSQTIGFRWWVPLSDLVDVEFVSRMVPA
jgi:hypothetical protein